MFTLAQINNLIISPKDGLTATPDSNYALYKFTRNDKIEFILEKKYYREGNNIIGYMETIARFYMNANDGLLDDIYILLRNCLLVERKPCPDLTSTTSL